MNILIVTAHPNATGFAHKIAEQYKQSAEKKGHTVKVQDLYSTEYKQDFLQLDEKNKYIADPMREKIQKDIKRADEIVFSYPMRRFDCPAIMKNRLDSNLTPGFAYNYISGKLTAQKLLTGKKAKIFTTAGGPTWVFYTIGLGTIINFLVGRFGYVGIKLSQYTVFGNMGKKRSPEQRQKMLDKVARSI